MPPDLATRTNFAGVYAFQIQGWLRAHDETGQFIIPNPSARPRVEVPVVMAGFQPHQNPPPAGDIGEPGYPLPEQHVNTGYYPAGMMGVITYAMNRSVSGHFLLSIGGNVNPKLLTFDGTYELLGSEGTCTMNASNGESNSYYILLVDDDREIMCMENGGVPNAAGRYIMALGVQKRLTAIK